MNSKNFDVIIIGGSYSGLAAAMALGRALKQVLVIDNGKPCNRQTPHSHNFLTQDGSAPAEIAAIARAQVEKYSTVTFVDGLALAAEKQANTFTVSVSSGTSYSGNRLIFATGIKDEMPNIDGFANCWGISALHCPYCHGYEVRNATTGILGNGDAGFDLVKLIANWTRYLTLFTNGVADLTDEQVSRLKSHNIKVVEKEITRLQHVNGYVENIHFSDGTSKELRAIYAPRPFEQHCKIPNLMGCELTQDGYVKIDPSYETTIKGVYACGDNASRMRTVANAVAMGTATGMMVSKKMIIERF